MPAPEIKGRVVFDTIQFARKRLGDEFLEKLLEKLGEPYRKLIDRGISQADWYPVELLTRFLEIECELLGLDENVFRKGAEEAAAAQLTGTYRALLQYKPADGLRKYEAHQKTYFKNVPLTLVSQGPNCGVFRYEGFGPQHRLMEPLIIGFARQLVLLLGGKKPRVTFTVPIGDPRGYAEMEMAWETGEPAPRE